MSGRLSGASARQDFVDRLDQIVETEQGMLAFEPGEGQRIGGARELDQLRHVALHARPVDEGKPERDPVETGRGETLLGGELRAAIGVGRAGLVLLGQHALAGRPRLRPDRGQKHEALHTRALGGLGEADRGLGVEQAIIVLRHAGHRAREARGVDHRIDLGERLGHVVRPGEIADDGARAASARRSGGAAARASDSRASAAPSANIGR